MLSSGLLRRVAPTQKTPFFIVTAVKTSNLTSLYEITNKEIIKTKPLNYKRFEVFTAVTMKNAVFCHITPRGSYKD
jgi:hypothetical protein